MNHFKNLRLEPVLDAEQKNTYIQFRNSLLPRKPMSRERLDEFAASFPPSGYLAYFLCYEGDQLIGGANIYYAYWIGQPNEVMIQPIPILGEGSHERADAIRLLLEQHAREKGYTLCRSLVQESDTANCASFEGAGYQMVQEDPITVLSVAEFEPQRWQPVVDQVKASGIRFVTAEELSREGRGWIEQAWRMEKELEQDIPQPSPPTESTLDEYTRFIDADIKYHKTMLYAVDGEELVGESAVYVNGVRADLYSTGLTGIRRSHRRRGIATALKAILIQMVMEMGAQSIATSNEANNPMLELNRALGYKHVDTWRTYQKDL